MNTYTVALTCKSVVTTVTVKAAGPTQARVKAVRAAERTYFKANPTAETMPYISSAEGVLVPVVPVIEAPFVPAPMTPERAARIAALKAFVNS